jgi:hypothetical protein
MTDSSELREIQKRIQIIEDNLRQLQEQATALSGAADEERIASRIADQEAKLAALLMQREALISKAQSEGTGQTADLTETAMAASSSAAPSTVTDALAGRITVVLGLPDGAVQTVIVIANFLLSALISAAIFKFVPSVAVIGGLHWSGDFLPFYCSPQAAALVSGP